MQYQSVGEEEAHKNLKKLKHLGNLCAIDVKHFVKQLCNFREKFVQHLWITCKLLFNLKFWNFYKTVKSLLNTCEAILKHVWNLCEIFVKLLWSIYATFVKLLRNICKQFVKHLRNTCKNRLKKWISYDNISFSELYRIGFYRNLGMRNNALRIQ